ncbi:MAG: prepilin-type N-terminal cleavage/methylation domain-containing protein [Candidatus Omnitrophica bacterium]|nr:prepilin-type N-terminal cleavage/methylation domain-containing protein [Candidatus Omnitrophota bacterium]
MKRKKHYKSGVTLIELMMSVLLGTILLGIVLGAWYFTYRNWALDRIRTKNRVELQIAVERIKSELRLSSTTYLSLHPAGETEYTAISFPMADSDANGFFSLDGDGHIDWDKSVIYHVYDNSSTGFTELRKTEFTSNHDVLVVDAQRETQLANAVANGDGSSGPNSANATTETIVEKLTSFIINPQAQEFDGYSPTAKKSDNVTFGSVRLTSGNHDFRFEVTGKNTNNTDPSGYKFGIDTLSISPSGCKQEMEVYTPQASSGDTSAKIGPNLLWSGNNFQRYSADAVGDYATFRLYYDSWLESNFDNSVRENTILTGDDLSVQLPDLDSGEEVTWTADVEAGSVNGDAVKADFPLTLAGITIRNVISSVNIDSGGNAFRVQFDSHSTSPLTIDAAYIDERDSGENCVNPPVTTTPGETRIQLYFTDALDNILPGITIPAGESAYSNWAIFPIDSSKNYFVTFSVSGASFASHWAGTEPTETNSYLMGGDYAAQAVWSDVTHYLVHESLPPFADERYTSSANIYAQASLEVWSQSGSVTTQIYDTKIANPVYRPMNYSSFGSVSVYGRSSDDSLMSGASAWTAGSVTGTGRYAQAKADLSVIPYWTCIDHSAAINVPDSSYKNSGMITCSGAGCGKFLIPTQGVNAPWVDNILVTWPGETTMCDISGYFAQDSDYGIIKLLVDGNELIKGMEFNVTVYEDFQGAVYTTSQQTEVEPRNTGK